MKNILSLVKNYYNKYQLISEAVKASIWFAVCSALQKGLLLISTPIFTRLLTTKQYGVYSVYQSWYAVISIFATLNLHYAVFNNGMTKYPDDRKRYISSMQGLGTTLTVILMLIYIIGRKSWNDLTGLPSVLFFAMFAEFIFAPAFNFWSAEQRYDYKYKALGVITVLMAVLSPVIGVIAVIFTTTFKAEAMVFSFVGVQVCVGLLFYIYNMMQGKTLFHWNYWKFVLKFNLPLIPYFLSLTILNQSDRIMISKMSGTGNAAIYTIAYTVAMMMTIVTNAINTSFIPYTYKAIQTKEFDSIKKNANVLLILVGGACGIAMAFGPEIIKIFAAPQYYDAIWVVPPVAAAVYFMFLYPVLANIEFYYEKTVFVMIASCMAAVVNIILNYIGIPIFGYYAAGYTTLICYILSAIAHYFFYRKIIKKELPGKGAIYDGRFMIVMSIIVLVLMVCMTILYNYTILRYCVIVISLVGICIKRKLIVSKVKEILINRKK